MSTNEQFDFWAIVELMGHSVTAGFVTRDGAFIRVDVTFKNEAQNFTKFYNPAAIYGITPTSETAAIAAAESMKLRPIAEWTIPALAAPRDEDDYPGEHWEDD